MKMDQKLVKAPVRLSGKERRARMQIITTTNLPSNVGDGKAIPKEVWHQARIQAMIEELQQRGMSLTEIKAAL